MANLVRKEVHKIASPVSLLGDIRQLGVNPDKTRLPPRALELFLV
jgi:hypothetical protein